MQIQLVGHSIGGWIARAHLTLTLTLTLTLP
jgi:hypothetical protein